MAKRNLAPLIVIIIVLLAAAGGAVYLFVFEPRARAEASRDQVKEWGVRWGLARQCILGDAAWIDDGAVAVAVAELSGSEGLGIAAKTCSEQVQMLLRPAGAEATPEVEDAFADLPAVYETYSKALLGRSVRSEERAVQALAEAIAKMDDFHDRLRGAARMPALEASPRQPVKLPEPTPLLAGSTAVQSGDLVAGALRGEQATESGVISYAITGPGQAVSVRGAAQAVVATPGGAWMAGTVAAFEFDEKRREDEVAIAVGPADAVWDPATAVLLPVPATPNMRPVAAIDAPGRRDVVIDTGNPYSPPAFLVMRSTDGGVKWSRVDVGAPPGMVVARPCDVVTGRCDVAVLMHDGDGGFLYRFGPAWATPSRAGVGAEVTDSCRGGDRLWWRDGADLMHLADGAPAPASLPLPPRGVSVQLRDCTATAALLEISDAELRYYRCTQGGCVDALDVDHPSARAAIVDDQHIAVAAATSDVILLYTEGTPSPTVFTLPRDFAFGGLVTWSGVPHAILTSLDSGDLLAVALQAP